MARIDALGWYVTFGHVTRMEAMRRHYRDLIGLPQYRHARIANGDAEDKDLFWAGEAAIMNFNHGGTVPAAAPYEADPARARQVPLFRVHNLDTCICRLAARGVRMLGPVEGNFGREAFAIDPMGNLTGLREARLDTDNTLEREAQRRWARGEAFNPGCAPMPNGWQELGTVRIRAADPIALARHYADSYGMRVVAQYQDTVLLEIGDNVGLEFAPGGSARPAPAQQMAAGSAMIVRVASLDAVVDAFGAIGVTHVGRRYDTALGSWAYFSDPEGNLLGCAERKHPAAYCDAAPVAPEDIEARRRAVELAGPAPTG